MITDFQTFVRVAGLEDGWTGHIQDEVNGDGFVYTVVVDDGNRFWVVKGRSVANRIGYLILDKDIDMPESGLVAETKVDQGFISRVIDERTPLGKFYCYDKGVFIGVDNTTGDAWTEEFDSLEECQEWLGI